jgi:hypothetical protein
MMTRIQCSNSSHTLGTVPQLQAAECRQAHHIIGIDPFLPSLARVLPPSQEITATLWSYAECYIFALCGL